MKQATQKTEDKPDPMQVRSPLLSNHRRFKNKSGIKIHAGSIANELWVDGPNATAEVAPSPHPVEKSAHPETSFGGRNQITSERNMVSAPHMTVCLSITQRF